MNKFFLLNLLVLYAMNGLVAQSAILSPSSFSISASVFTGHSLFRENIYSDLGFSGKITGAALEFRFKTKSNRTHFVSAAYLNGHNYLSSNSEVSARENVFIASYTFLFPMLNPEQPIQFNLGGQAQLVSAVRKYAAIINSHNTQDLFATLGIQAALEVPLYAVWKGLSFEEKSGIPVVAVIRDYPVSGATSEKYNYTFGTFKALTGFNTAAILHKDISQAMTLSVFYKWNYYNLKDSKKTRQEFNELGICYLFTL